MKKQLLLKRVLLFLAAFVLLYSCREEELTLTSKATTQRNNADFFKHSGKGSAYAKNAVDYISILEAYNEETDFLKQMPDQEGMPVWDKMQVFYSEEGAGAIIPLSYDKETLSSVLFATFDPENSVKAVRNITNRQLEDMTLNRNYSTDFREGILTSFLIADHYTFGTTEFTNIPKDLFKGMKHGKDSIRLSFSTFSVEEGMGSASGKFSHVSTTCLNIYHCKNNKPISACDGCSQCVTKTCSSAYIFTDDDGDIPPPHSNPGGGGGSGGSGPYPEPPKDPCGLSESVFYRMKPNCGDTGGEIGDLPNDDPCNRIKNWFANPKFKSKYDSLTRKTPTSVFDLDHELAFYMRYAPQGTSVAPGFVDVDMPPCSTDGNLPTFTEGMGGLGHTHNNNTCNGNIPIRVPSPTDIRTFINILIPEAGQYTGSYLNAYSLVATSDANYMMMYNGTDYPGAIKYDERKKLQKDYEREFQYLYSRKENVTQADLERVFIKFMDQQVNRPGIEVYRVTPEYAIKMEYDSASPNSVKLTPCP